MDEVTVTVRSPEEYDALVEKVAAEIPPATMKPGYYDRIGEKAKDYYRRKAHGILEAIGITRPEPDLAEIAARAYWGNGGPTASLRKNGRWQKVADAVVDAYEGRAQ